MVAAAAEVQSEGHTAEQGGAKLNARGSGFHLREDLEDALDSEHVPTELVAELAAREERALRLSSSSKGLPKAVRQLAVRFLAQLMYRFTPTMEDWFAAVVLFDALATRTPGGLRVEALPATCGALAKMVKKMDSAENRLYLLGMNAKVVAAASQLAQCLQRLGYRQDPVDTQELHRQEWELLRTLRWQITLPCQESWLSIFCTRLDVLTASILQTSIGWAREQSTAMVNTLVMWQATSARLPPRRMAAGALSINLARAGLLPLEALRAPEVSSAQWGHLLVEAGIKEPSRQSSLNSSLVQYTLQALQTAVGCSRTTLQKASELVLRDVCNLRGDEQGHVASR
uniref:Cyclin N-terminal domain-containing protein n=2 Tax=Pyrodinium bahamense TaxID=73915 RepID=A0A7S0AMQ8_9DINO|mmetsp:Transcript_37855/g.105328  ORF Transcript_37855/g.105328 Transcript_37855/m.105328 type:complete len:343 (+) Transcript_37855:63-1091(+)